MRQGEFYRQTEQFVNEVCGAFIAPSEEWARIECKHSGSDGICYIKIVDVTDDSYYYDITGLTLEQVAKLVAAVVAEVDTGRQIVARDQRKEVAALFR